MYSKSGKIIDISADLKLHWYSLCLAVVIVITVFRKNFLNLIIYEYI